MRTQKETQYLLALLYSEAFRKQATKIEKLKKRAMWASVIGIILMISCVAIAIITHASWFGCIATLVSMFIIFLVCFNSSANYQNEIERYQDKFWDKGCFLLENWWKCIRWEEPDTFIKVEPSDSDEIFLVSVNSMLLEYLKKSVLVINKSEED